VAALEVLVSTSAVANLIREGKTFQIPSAMQTGAIHGMLTFESSIRKLISQGMISKKDGEAFLGNHKSAEEFQPPHSGGNSPKQQPLRETTSSVTATGTKVTPPTKTNSGTSGLLKPFGFKKKVG